MKTKKTKPQRVNNSTTHLDKTDLKGTVLDLMRSLKRSVFLKKLQLLAEGRMKLKEREHLVWQIVPHRMPFAPHHENGQVVYRSDGPPTFSSDIIQVRIALCMLAKNAQSTLDGDVVREYPMFFVSRKSRVKWSISTGGGQGASPDELAQDMYVFLKQGKESVFQTRAMAFIASAMG